MPFAVGQSTTVLEGLAPYESPESLPKLYEFEACPFCRRAREAVTALDLEVEIYPCGRGSRHRAAAKALGGKEHGGAGRRGGGAAPSLLSTALRFGRGAAVSPAAPAAAPAKLLELYSYDGNQFCRLAREALCELDIPYVLRSAGKGSPRRAALEALAGSSRCPYLVDPNTGAALGESADIVDYLRTTYGAAAAPPSPKDELLALPRTRRRARGEPALLGAWDLLWTTERELNFAMDKGLFAAGPCTGVSQTIDVAAGDLENTVLFDNDSKLFVGSSIAPSPDDAAGRRFDFKFSSCYLQWRGTKVPLPPVGEGWGDILYLDDTLRVQRDIRGDVLIATRATK
ncbi:glutathione S-transferase [Aureococcus anophagefferens]|nr:glutathione S-transferase [Aureococcus anophagefferens]